jgi:hypothetical protein
VVDVVGSCSWPVHDEESAVEPQQQGAAAAGVARPDLTTVAVRCALERMCCQIQFVYIDAWSCWQRLQGMAEVVGTYTVVPLIIESL